LTEINCEGTNIIKRISSKHLRIINYNTGEVTRSFNKGFLLDATILITRNDSVVFHVGRLASIVYRDTIISYHKKHERQSTKVHILNRIEIFPRGKRIIILARREKRLKKKSLYVCIEDYFHVRLSSENHSMKETQ